MSTKTTEQRPMRSGFCNRSWPLEDPSHGRCRLDGCRCDCHTAAAEPVAAAVVPAEPAVDVVPDTGPCRCWTASTAAGCCKPGPLGHCCFRDAYDDVYNTVTCGHDEAGMELAKGATA